MKRGEIWTASGGADYAGKPRPVLVVQDDDFGDTGSVTICLLTSHAIEADLIRPPITPTPENGLRETSYAMADKVTTVPRSRLGRRIGKVTSVAMAPVSRAIMVFLGLAGQARGDQRGAARGERSDPKFAPVFVTRKGRSKFNPLS